MFQGNLHRRRYFEGWYLKHARTDLYDTAPYNTDPNSGSSRTETRASDNPENDRPHNKSGRVVSFIPGISLFPGDRHAFVQYIDGGTGKSGYTRYPLDQFKWSRDSFDVTIGPNRFSRTGCEIDIKDSGGRSDPNKKNTVSGRLVYRDPVPFPSKPNAPGIMGWYSFVPFMECNHDVVSITHRVKGEIRIDGEDISFQDDKGYIEKDWGASFPKAWLWLQCNNFSEADTSLMVSVARIPWLGGAFTGFLAFLYVRGRLYLYSTYNGSKIGDFTAQPNSARLTLKGKDTLLLIHARREAAATLEAPLSGEMSRSIRESVDGKVDLELYDTAGSLLYRDAGIAAGMEAEGPINEEAGAAGFTTAIFPPFSGTR